jgi:pimeloyl-ACP methyl ester carboxylesterase
MAQVVPRRRLRRKIDTSRLGVLPPSRTLDVYSVDGTRLHTEVFGPDDGYPIVLCHGITCAIRVWAYQIADLSADHRVIAFDHRGHGRSDVPPRGGYSLDLLAADLDAVLDATVKPHERAVIAGHSMGGIAITSWAHRYPDRVQHRAAAAALINTTTGDVLRELRLVRVPDALADVRIRVAQDVIKAIGDVRVPRGARWGSHRFVAAMAVGADADPAVGKFVYELFAATPPAGRGGCARMLVDALGPEHISLDGLTVPTLVIGSEKDRLLPIGQSRKIADAAPNLAALVELPGGHCANLEHPDEVNRLLRELVASATAPRRASS